MVRFNTLALAVLVFGSFGAAGSCTAHAATATAPAAGTAAIAPAATETEATATTGTATTGAAATGTAGAAALVAPALDINNIELWLEGERLVQSGVNTVVADHLYHGEALLSYSGAGATLPLAALQLTSNNPNVVIETGEGTLVTGADGVTRISLPYTLVVHGEVGPNPIVVSIGIQRTDGGVVHGTSQGQSFIIGSSEPGDGDGNGGGDPEDPGDGNGGGDPEDPGDGNEGGDPEDPGDGNEGGDPEDPGDGNGGDTENPGGGDEGNPETPGDGNAGNPEKPGDDDSATVTPAEPSTPSTPNKPATPGVAHPVAERPTTTHETARQLPQTGERKAPVLALAGLVLVALSVAVGASKRWGKDA